MMKKLKTQWSYFAWIWESRICTVTCHYQSLSSMKSPLLCAHSTNEATFEKEGEGVAMSNSERCSRFFSCFIR